MAGLASGGRRLGLRFDWQAHDEARAVAVGHGAARRDAAAVALDDAAADGEAEPGPGDLPVAVARAVELVEDALQVLGRDAGAFVA